MTVKKASIALLFFVSFLCIICVGCSSSPETIVCSGCDNAPITVICTDCGSPSLPTVSTTHDVAPEAKSQNEIIADVSASNFYTERYPEFTITGLEVIKRQTNVNNMTDTVYATLTIGNEAMQAHMDIKLLYGLYNEGWILDNCTAYTDGKNSECSYTPLSGQDLSSEDILAALYPITGDSVTDFNIYNHETDLEAGTESYSITVTETHKYMTATAVFSQVSCQAPS